MIYLWILTGVTALTAKMLDIDRDIKFLEQL